MKLRKSLPKNLNYEQAKNQYLAEKAIAKRLMESNREQRKIIYATMYDEVLSKMPDHPRLTHNYSLKRTAKANKQKYSILRGLLNKSTEFLEFAPGDCGFVFDLARHIKFAYGIDISDQHNSEDEVPDNFKMITYDGYNLNEIESDSIDIIFSDQLIEHLHPEDTILHFELVHRILKKGGKYAFRMPHALTGPHDISKHFSDTPECFHLKEWTYTEMNEMLSDLKFSKFITRYQRYATGYNMPYKYFEVCENILQNIPKKNIRLVTKFLLPSLCGMVVK